MEKASWCIGYIMQLFACSGGVEGSILGTGIFILARIWHEILPPGR